MTTKQKATSTLELLEQISEDVGSVKTGQEGHATRLSKIEEAILQLTATQERVKAMGETVEKLNTKVDSHIKEAWEAFDKIREKELVSVEARAQIYQQMSNNTEHICKLELFKENVATQISSNTKIRYWFEKGLYMIVLITVMGMLSFFFQFQQPAQISELISKVTRIEKSFEEHKELTKDNEELN